MLNGHSSRPGAPAAAPPIVGSHQVFSQPFAFPGGQQCKNFDQLAVACQQHWSQALDLLKQGTLEKFFAGIGRADLAMAARQAAQFPDKDRGLDQFLSNLTGLQSKFQVADSALSNVVQALEIALSSWRLRSHFRIPPDQSALIAEIHRVGHVLDLRYDGDDALIIAHVPPHLEAKLARYSQ